MWLGGALVNSMITLFQQIPDCLFSSNRYLKNNNGFGDKGVSVGGQHSRKQMYVAIFNIKIGILESN